MTIQIKELKGRHVLFCFLAFFGLVALVNAVFVTLALTSFSGVETEDAYRRGLAYNETLAAAQAQKDRAWQVSLEQQDGQLLAAFANGDGQPLDGLRVLATIGRPANDTEDRTVTLEAQGAGRYQAGLGLSEDDKGQWQVWLRAEDAEGVLHPHGATPMAEVTAIRAGHWEGAGLHAFLDTATGGSKTLYLIVDGIHCPGCIRKIEGCLLALPGVTAARLNFSTKRLTVCWQSGQQDAEVILETLAAQGYDAVPYDPKRLGTASQAQQSALLRALGVAGFAAANVMLLSVSVWSGLVEDMDHTTRLLFHWLSALIALPAIAYAGRPFYRSAVAALRAQRLNMDVPIALAIVLASALSLYRTAVGEDYVYFDAALMLVFFLLIGRALDLRVRGQGPFGSTEPPGLEGRGRPCRDARRGDPEPAGRGLAAGHGSSGRSR